MRIAFRSRELFAHFFHRPNASKGRSSFIPSLEHLEERVVPTYTCTQVGTVRYCWHNPVDPGDPLGGGVQVSDNLSTESHDSTIAEPGNSGGGGPASEGMPAALSLSALDGYAGRSLTQVGNATNMHPLDVDKSPGLKYGNGGLLLQLEYR
jgi:hypothetical protein